MRNNERNIRRHYQKQLRRLAAAVAFSLAASGWALPAVGSAAQQIVVRQYDFTGETLAAADELEALVADSLGASASLEDLEKQANRVTRYLRDKGYMVAFAYVPDQDFAQGNVRIAVEPGRYDAVIIDNATRIKESAILRELGPVRAGEIVRKDALERAVFLIGDLTNAEAKTTLRAGKKPGTTTLTIHVKPKGNPTWGYVGVDNGGYRYTGRYEWTALVNRGNPARRGDILSGSFLYTGQGQTGGSLSYNTPVWNQGSRVGISYARSQYTLGGPFEPMGATGTADTLSLSYQKNFKRSREMNSYGGIRYENKRLNDDLSAFGQEGRKRADNWIADVHGDWKDGWQGGGENTYSLSYTYGNMKLKDEVSEILDDPANGGPGAAGRFGRCNLELTRLQTIRDRLALFLSYARQWSNKNLDSSEKMNLGGPYGVRAYPAGEASGDQGWTSTAELRWNLPKQESSPDVWQLIAFVDGGGVQQSRNPAAGADNRRNLYGMGVGVNWSNENNWAGRLHYAWKLGSEEAVSDTDKHGRLWFQLYKFF